MTEQALGEYHSHFLRKVELYFDQYRQLPWQRTPSQASPAELEISDIVSDTAMYSLKDKEIGG